MEVCSSASFGALATGFLACDFPVALAGFLELEHGQLGSMLSSLQFAQRSALSCGHGSRHL